MSSATRHVTIKNRPAVQTFNSTRENRRPLPLKSKSSWRLQSRKNTDAAPTFTKPNFSHLNKVNRKTVQSIWQKRTVNKRTLKNPKMARYLASIESRFNDPINMKTAVRNAANSNLSPNEKNELITDINELYPSENYYKVKRGIGSRYLVPKPMRLPFIGRR